MSILIAVVVIAPVIAPLRGQPDFIPINARIYQYFYGFRERCFLVPGFFAVRADIAALPGRVDL